VARVVESQPDLVQQILKAPYTFAFLALGAEVLQGNLPTIEELEATLGDADIAG